MARGTHILFSTLGLLLSAAAFARGQAEPAAPVDANSIPPRIRAFLEEGEELRRGSIIRLEQELRALRARAADSPKAQRQAEKIAKDLQTLEANRTPLVPALKFPPEVGAIGRLPRLSCHVEQVLTGDQMLVRCNFPLQVRTVKNFQPRYESISRPLTFLIRGLSTDKAREGGDLEMLEVFEIVGTHTYQTEAGQPQKVYVLTPFDMRPVQRYFEALSVKR